MANRDDLAAELLTKQRELASLPTDREHMRTRFAISIEIDTIRQALAKELRGLRANSNASRSLH
jgi:hypothetical protein